MPSTPHKKKKKKVVVSPDPMSVSRQSLRSMASTSVSFLEPKTLIGKVCVVNMATRRGKRVQVK